MKASALAALFALSSVMVQPGNSAQDVKFYFFSENKNNVADRGKASYHPLSSDIDAKELLQAGFNKSQQTKILIHGLNNDVTSPMIQVLTEAYHQLGRYNLIAVDWSALSSLLHYLQHKKLIHQVAEHVVTLISILVRERLSAEGELHIIAHSLAAHVAGVAGKILKHVLGRITGLDPAGVFMDLKDTGSRLARGDAKCVDVYHTSSLYGILTSIGDADFFANGGKRQPGCPLFRFPPGGCDHGRAFLLYAETILHPFAFPAHLCKSDSDAMAGTCEASETALAGEYTNVSLPGPRSYYFKTNEDYPFSLRRSD